MVTRPCTRRAWLSAAACTVAGCAVVDGAAPPPGWATAPSAAREAQRPPPGPALLTPWQTVQGGWGDALPGGGSTRILLRAPMAVAARADIVWVGDAGWRRWFRLDRPRDRLLPLGPFTPAGADHATGLALQPDGSAWWADAAAARVRALDPAGRERGALGDERLLARPVAVAQPVPGGDLFVADAQTAQIVVLSALGTVLRRFGSADLQSVAALVSGPEGLYALDRLAQQVVVFTPEGRALRAVGSETLVQPRALAVDEAGRVFVGDDANQTIHTFTGAARPTAFGGFGNAPGRFGRIDALAVSGGQLWVADSANARLQVLLVSTPSLMEGGR